LDYIRRQLTMQDVIRLMSYWSKHPPLHILLAAWLDPANTNNLQQPVTEPNSLQPFLGSPEKPPAHIRDLVEWTERTKPLDAAANSAHYCWR
jgi:hypothetical protein